MADVEMPPVDADVLNEDVDISPEHDGALFKKILRAGTGSEHPPRNSEVKVHYVGTLEDGSKFDSSRDRDDPFSFKLGTGGVIKGWDIGVATMKKGELAVLRVRSDLGYGASGSPPKIPGGATLLFEVELLSWESGVDISDPKAGTLVKHVTTESEKSWDHPQDDARVKMHVHSVRVNGADVRPSFDLLFSMGAREVPTVFETAAHKMGLGERAVLHAHAPYHAPDDSAYLSSHSLPSSSVVQYDVELVEFEKFKSSWEMTNPEKLSTAGTLRNEGNAFYQSGNIARALTKYKRALSYVEFESSFDKSENKDEESKAKTAAEIKEARELRVVIWLNMAAISLKGKDYKEVVALTKKVLELNDKNSKALFRRGVALGALGEWDAAVRDLETVKELCPGDEVVKKELEGIERKRKAQEKKDRAVFKKMIAESGDE